MRSAVAVTLSSLGNRQGIFDISGDMSVMVFREYYAIGSGVIVRPRRAARALRDREGRGRLARRACEGAITFDV